MPRSMPMCQVQLKSTARRSLVPAAGLYGGGGSRFAPGACAPAVDSALIVRTTSIATLVQIILRRKAMMVLRCCLIVGVTGGDLDHAPVRHGHRLRSEEHTSELQSLTN